MKQVLSEMDIIITSPLEEIISQNKCQMRFRDNLVLKQNIDQKLMIDVINWSMLESQYTSDYD